LFVKYLENDHPTKVRKNRLVTFEYNGGARISNLTYVHFDHYDVSILNYFQTEQTSVKD
jgi:hypothetical protein